MTTVHENAGHRASARPDRADSLKQFGERIRARRLERGLTQLELAEGAGVDRKTISRIENSRFSPSLINIYAIADALNIEVRDLI
jgi:transcriptional regulator with XRE-family HTH domain